MTAVPPPKVLLQPKMSTGVPTTSIPTKKEVMKNLERSIFERPNGRTLMYTTGFLLFTGGLIMAYFGYRAHEFHQKTLAVGNHTIEVQSEELNAWHHSQMVYRGYFSMQFIGPTLAAMGAFLVMLSVVGHFIHREEMILGRRRHRDYQVSQC